MTDYQGKAKAAQQSANRMEKLARKGRTEPSRTAPDGTRNGPAEIAKDHRHAERIYRHLDKTQDK